MRKNKIILGLSLIALSMSLSSCDLYNSIFHKDSNKVDATLPGDREEIVVKKEVGVFTPDELKRGAVMGDWAIETVYGKKCVGEKAPYLKFVPSEGRFYGNNGCNVMNGGYSYNAQDSTLSFSNVAMTMMMCGKEGLTDYEINTAMGATKYYSWEEVDSDYILTLYDETGNEVMKLLHQNFEFLNGAWRVSHINETEVKNRNVKLVIDVNESKVHGNTGCNILNGALDVNMEYPNYISFSAIATTRMACPDADNSETAFLVALEEVTRARLVKSGEVRLYNDRDKEVIRLVRNIVD